MKNKKEIVDNKWINFLMSDLSGKIITTFKDVFLGIYFLKITQGNIVDVSIYFITLYLVYPMFLYLVNKLNKINLVNIFRIGLFANLCKCILLLVSGEKIVNFIILFGVIDSLGDAFYYYSQQLLIKRLNSESNIKKYFTVNYIIKSILGISIPSLFGYCIAKSSWSLAFSILSVCTLFSFIISFTIKGYNLEHSKINLKKFKANIIENKEQKIMKLLTFRTIARALSSYGVLSTLITIITFMVVKNEFSLGNISSIVTILSMIMIFLIGKFVNKKQISKSFVPVAILQSIVIIAVTFSLIFGNANAFILGTSISISYVLILAYNVINGLCNPFFEYVNNIIYYECMSKQKIKLEDEPNYNFYFETINNFSRAIGYIILIIVSKLAFNLNIIAILIVGFTFIYMLLAFILKEIEQKFLMVN